MAKEWVLRTHEHHWLGSCSEIADACNHVQIQPGPCRFWTIRKFILLDNVGGKLAVKLKPLMDYTVKDIFSICYTPVQYHKLFCMCLNIHYCRTFIEEDSTFVGPHWGDTRCCNPYVRPLLPDLISYSFSSLSRKGLPLGDSPWPDVWDIMTLNPKNQN